MDFGAQKAKLLAEKAELTKKLSNLEGEYGYEFADEGQFNGDRPGYTGDYDDALIDQRDRTRLALFEVSMALGRLESGTYGKCAGCGQDIDKVSLDTKPGRSLCESCQDTDDEWYSRLLGGNSTRDPLSDESVGEFSWQEWEWVAGNTK